MRFYLRKECLDATDLCKFNVRCCATVGEVSEADLEKKEKVNLNVHLSLYSISQIKYGVRVTGGLICFNGSLSWELDRLLTSC